MTRYILCSYRHIRNRDVDNCAEDLFRLFRDLASLNSELFKWKLTSRSERNALSNSFIDINDKLRIKDIVSRGINRREDNKEIIADLGYQTSFWNGATSHEKTATLSVINGGFNPVVFNSVILNFPEFEDLGRNDDLVASLMRFAVEAIDAEWGRLNRDEIESPGEEDFFLDRAIYAGNSFTDPSLTKVAQDAERCINLGHGRIFLKKIAT